MEIPKIKFSAISNMTDSNLSVFAQQTINNIKDNDRYKDMLALFTDYQKVGNDYIAALLMAKNRGIAEVVAKNELKASFLVTAKVFSTGLETYCKGDATYISDAGFPLVNRNSRPTPPTFLDPPFNIQAVSAGYSGGVKLSYKLVKPRDVRVVALEWSDDKGVTWHNGTYLTTTKTVLSNMPSRSEVYIRLCAIGIRDLKSAWSDPVVVSIL